MASKTEICNMALRHIGVGKEIANVDSELSAEASACRRFFESARDACFRDSVKFPKYQTLSLIEENPNDEWGFSYGYPTDCSRLIKILSGLRNDNRQSRITYEIAYDYTGKIIFTDQENAVAKYAVRVEDTVLWMPDYTLAVSWRLAVYIAPSVTDGDPFKLGDRAMKMYQYEMTNANANYHNEQQVEQEPEAESIRARE